MTTTISPLRPEAIADVILDAVVRRRVLAVTSPGLGQLWRAQRLGGPRLHQGATLLSRGLHGLGGLVGMGRDG